MERKTISAEDIRSQFNLSKQALMNYIKLAVLTPVAGTENNDNPLFYTDEVATIRESITTCQNSIKRLNSIRNNIMEEIQKANAALTVLQLDAAIKNGLANSIIDAITLFLKRAIPQLRDEGYPLCILNYLGNDDVEHLLRIIEGNKRSTPQDFINDLYHEVEVLDVTSLNNCLNERDALIEERNTLKKKVQELSLKISMVSDDSEAKACLTARGYSKELSEKQNEGLKKSIYDVDFSHRVINCLNAELRWDKERPIIADVVAFSNKDLGRIRNLGKNSKIEIKEKLAEYDLSLEMDVIEIGGKYYSR